MRTQQQICVFVICFRKSTPQIQRRS